MTSASDGNGRSELPPETEMPSVGTDAVGTESGPDALPGALYAARRVVTFEGGTGGIPPTPPASNRFVLLLEVVLPGSCVVEPLRCGRRTDVLYPSDIFSTVCV